MSSNYPKCDLCGGVMSEFDGVAWYTCPSCGNSIWKQDDGTFKTTQEVFYSKPTKKDIPPEKWRDFEDGIWEPEDL